jgi:hypothetical protein
MRPNAPAPGKSTEMAGYELRAFSALAVNGIGRRDVSHGRCPPGLQDTVFLGVVRLNDRHMQDSWAETGFIAQDVGHVSQKFGSRKVEPDKIDFDVINGWMKFCRENHSNQCELSSRQEVQGLRVINCQTRKIARARGDEKYVALSYVWGSTPSIRGCGTPSECLPDRLPSTIEDAIKTTTLLGLEYLWIDRFCILQNDEDERHLQISQMDSVYRNADVTIVAAAGEDPTHGLPGIDNSSRMSQQSIQISTGILRSTLPDGKFVVDETFWNKRGWTYQEAILSRRRLVFTKYQVYFQCNGMHCCESVSKPLDLLHVKSRQRMRAWNGDGPFNSGGLGTHPWQVLDRIAEFTKRQLSYESDVLNAMIGILNAFSVMKRPVLHHFGVPCLPPFMNTQKIGVAFGKLISLVPLPDNPDHGLATGLCWFLEKPSTRRAGFPSWSWTGWMGQVSKPKHDRLRYYFGFPESQLDVKIWVEFEDKSLQRWPDYISSSAIDKRPHPSPFLKIESYTVQIVFMMSSEKISNDGINDSPEHLEQMQTTDFFAKLLVKDPDNHDLFVYTDLILTKKVEQGSSLHSRLRTEPWTGILLGPPYLEAKDSRSRGGFIMVIDFLEGYGERIGHLNLVDIELGWRYQTSKLSIPVIKQVIRLG